MSREGKLQKKLALARARIEELEAELAAKWDRILFDARYIIAQAKQIEAQADRIAEFEARKKKGTK